MTTNVQAPAQVAGKSSSMPTMVLIAGWLIPGAGHLLQRKWIRGGLLMVSIVAMFTIGLALKGKIYSPNTGDLLDILNFAGDLGNGLLYVLGSHLRSRPGHRAGSHRRLRNQVHGGSRPPQHHLRRRRALAGHREETLVTISHFGAVLLFALFTSIVFGITQRSEPRTMIRFEPSASCSSSEALSRPAGSCGSSSIERGTDRLSSHR
ncbi:DUF6677 family protein [Tunturiibacter empetritectus]|uniref:DUF6677 family protein n=1 Tax=Tunturiibacter empetritectus TaxID=3069691 RepID=UPI003D9B10D9